MATPLPENAKHISHIDVIRCTSLGGLLSYASTIFLLILHCFIHIRDVGTVCTLTKKAFSITIGDNSHMAGLTKTQGYILNTTSQFTNPIRYIIVCVRCSRESDPTTAVFQSVFSSTRVMGNDCGSLYLKIYDLCASLVMIHVRNQEYYNDLSYEIDFMSCTRPKKKTDIKLNTLTYSFNGLLMTIDCPLLHGGTTNECAETTIYMHPG